MSDFSANIKAILDTSEIPNQLEKLNNKYNIVVKASKFDTSGIESKMKNAGANAGKVFASEFSNNASAIKTTINNATNTIRHMQDVLRSAKFKDESISYITKDLQSMNIELSHLHTSIGKDGIKLNIQGIDKYNNAVTVIKEFNYETGKISTVAKHIDQDFDTSADATKRFQKEVDTAFSTLQNMQKQMGNYRLKIAGLDELKDASQIETIKSKFGELKSEYNELYGVFGKHFSTEQTDKLIQGFSQVDDKIDILKSKMSDTFSLKNTKEEIKEFLSITKQMDSLKLGIGKSESMGNLNEASFLKEKLSELQTQYKSLIGTLYKKLPYDQFLSLINGASNAEDVLNHFNAKLDDVNQKLAKEINFKISTGEIDSDFNAIKAKFDSLNNVSAVTSQNFKNLDSAFKTLNSKDENITIEQKIAAYKEFNQLLPIVSKQISNLSQEERNSAKATKEVNSELLTLDKSSKLSNDITAWMNKNTKAAEVYKDRLDNLKNRLVDNKDPTELRKITTEFAKIKSEANASGLVVNSFAKSLKNTVKQVLGLTSAVAVFQKVWQLLKEMYQNVYDIDTAMTNLKKVTDETSTKYNIFLDSAAKKAKKLGTTIADVVEQTADWAKLGYSLDEASELAELSTIYANVGEIDSKTAISDMVTAMKAFNIEATNAQIIIDSLNELGNNYATSAGDLGQGLTKSASALHAAGADIYQTLALLTGGTEITQNATEFGQFLKTSSMRIRGMKGELEALGEEVDDNIDSISKVQTQILNLTHGKVNIFDDTGNFRNYYEIMKEIAFVYDDLQATDRASLDEILFGKRGANQGAALIQAFQSGQIEKAYNTALNSENSAIIEQEKWKKSLEAKKNQFKAAFGDLSKAFMDDGSLKNLIDVGTTFLSVLTKIIDALGSVPTLVTAIAAALSFKNIGKDKMFSFI